MAGQPAALAVVTTAGRGLGRLLATICNLTMPQRIILGGEGVHLAAVAEATIHEGIASARDHRAPTPPIHLTDGGNREWCRGAAALAIQATVLGTASGGD